MDVNSAHLMICTQERLRLYRNKISVHGARTLQGMLEKNKSLVLLDLSFNLIRYGQNVIEHNHTERLAYWSSFFIYYCDELLQG